MDYSYEDHGGGNIMWIFLILILVLFTGGMEW
ncbi:flagellar basal body-associated protein FliL [Halanaerobacter jeridensis]|uniref:Flagellar basal body-associated protein FliL n=1 Tax=Halanaerobacter jeridensis TaxID=706427 RepID=A0A939BPS2_9FIRM|nr:flagellar basal body-associated protein FliL [Halanaerobacter jeridensis]